MKKITIYAFITLIFFVASITSTRAGGCFYDMHTGELCYAADGTSWGGHERHISNLAPTYDIVFNKESTYDTPNNRYLVCPGSMLSIKNIVMVRYSCGNPSGNDEPADLVGWVYNGNTKLALNYNGRGVKLDTERSQIIPGVVYHPACMYFAASRGNSMNLYTFNDPNVNYITYIDLIKAYCVNQGYNPDYICDYLGGCNKWPFASAPGWTPLKEFGVKVLNNPAVTITPPQPISANSGATVNPAWTITNTGADKTTIYISRNCGSASCSFQGYSENSPVSLDPGQAYTVVMPVVVPSASQQLGITVTYDDGYGFSCIAPAVSNSLIQVNVIASNNAGFVSQSVPPMCAGGSYVVSVAMKNIGSTTWTAAGNYRLGSQNPQDNIIWGTGRAYLSGTDSIAPGMQKTFSFTVTAPGTAGTYNFQWRMLQEFIEWFGQITPNVVVTVNNCTTTTLPPLPDLTVDDIYLVDQFGNKLPDPTTNSSTASGNLFYSVKNIGGSDANATQSSVTWLDSSLNPGGNSIDDVVALPASTSSQEWLGLHSCPTPGHFFYWRVCADASNNVTEVSENNNCYQERWWCPGITATTTTTTSLSTSSTTSTTMTLYTRTVTLKYKVSDQHADQKFNCSVWTNIPGNWAVNRITSGVNSSETNRVVIYGVPEGAYGWTVNCTDGVIPKIFPKNASRITGGAPGPYWLFYVKAP